MALSRTLVERRNYAQLKWNNQYNEYYNRVWKKETLQYLSHKIKTKHKAFASNWKFNMYKNTELPDIPALRGHSLSDIGDSIIFIGDKKRKTRVDIYKMNKYLNKFEKLSANGSSPCCRFHHSANYIPSINCILFFGGFDSQCNFSDAWLLSLNNLSWYDLIYNAQIDYRAYHSATSRMLKNKFEIYIFGGQFCNGGPYEYHNDIFKFTFHNDNYIEHDEKKENEEKFGYFECDELQINGRNKPCARSMSYSWIVDNIYYLFGGSVATYTLNDLWALDLNTNIWTQIRYNGILKAPKTESFQPKDFRIVAKRKPCFFEQKLNELIVIHYGDLSEIQKEFMLFDDSLNEFEYRMKMIKRKKEKLKVKMKQKQLKCHIFRFDLREKQWYIERNIDDEKGDLPSKLIASTRIVRIGEYLIQMGGGYKDSKINYMKHLYLLKIPNYKVRNTMSWSRERLIWIAHYKGDENDNHNVSIFNKCPKDIIYFIVSFLNPKNTN